jgi:hypothetical protein
MLDGFAVVRSIRDPHLASVRRQIDACERSQRLLELVDRVLDVRCVLSRDGLPAALAFNRSFIDVLPGDAVMLTWPEASISNIAMRVVDVDHGTLENGAIVLGLIQDYYYANRLVPPSPIDVTVFGGASSSD